MQGADCYTDPPAAASAALAAAAAADDVRRVRQLLDCPATAPGRGAALHAAARRNAAGAAQALLEAGADALARASSAEWPHAAMTPLHVAAAVDADSVAQLLISKGGQACLRATCSGGLTPLHVAAQHGSARVARLLLQAGADVNAASASGSTPLHGAASDAGDGHNSVVRLLLAHAACVQATDAEGNTPLDLVADRRDTALQLLERLGQGPGADAAVLHAARTAAGCGAFAVLAVLSKEVGRRQPQALTGLFDELGPATCALAAPAIVAAWLADVGGIEQQQAQLAAEEQELQDTKRGLQHLLVAAACAARQQEAAAAADLPAGAD